jgi:uncharacterized membrane protein YhaH (DUF805 family)
MDWIWYLFSFEGRINRAKYWLAGLIIGCWMVFLMLLLLVPIGYLFGWPENPYFSIENVFAIIDPASYRKLSRSDISTIIVNVLTMPLLWWVFVATSVKRLHDRGRSGWWIVPFYIAPTIYQQFAERLPDSYWVLPLALAACVLFFWGIVEMYFLRGTKSTNQYGPDPLSEEQLRARAERTTKRWDQQSEIEMVPHKSGPPPGMRVIPGA